MGSRSDRGILSAMNAVGADRSCDLEAAPETALETANGEALEDVVAEVTVTDETLAEGTGG